MFKAHEHRVRALEMLLISLRTPDALTRGRYARLSAALIAVAEKRERLSWRAAKLERRWSGLGQATDPGGAGHPAQQR
jgi:hypothetical protein